MARMLVPPIRTALVQNGQDTPAVAAGATQNGDRTAPEWYLYWQQSGDAVNANTVKLAGLVTYGKHAARPTLKSPQPPPDGALYFEQDRGSALYQFQKGAWMYVSGTMWGTLSPDQRPTDLGSPNDIGFDFWATDQTPVRKFIWSGSAWLEQTIPILTDQTLTAATTVNAPASGNDWSVILRQDATGGWPITWGPNITATHTAIDATASTISTFRFIKSGSNWVMVGQPTTGMTP